MQPGAHPNGCLAPDKRRVPSAPSGVEGRGGRGGSEAGTLAELGFPLPGLHVQKGP